ncbi:COPI associated protein-domain-containing protein [Cokeromyces recurvatus]|uniref:COPI associated protein-domain-containing protein n=1 Tax=Cokeromyces recurvatus TaxID=90255 RepID=UPI0022210665|nr:COPI associated protein-domain-containing protein [Cokeromyces recurvatus]KAI7899259.1 COPI associated protein-domain-containing protein [Cokeromyces recurvatus]
MNLSIVFRVVNIIVAAFMIIGGIMTCIAGGFPNFIQGIFVIIFGLMTLLFEFRLPAMITQFASFMFSFMGRGLFYIFLGCITLSYRGLALASGIIVAVIGIVFVILHFFRNKIDIPSNMTKRAFEDAMSGYGSSQDNTTQLNDPTRPVPPLNYPTDGFSTTQSPYVANPNNPYPPSPTYPPANYTKSSAV